MNNRSVIAFFVGLSVFVLLNNAATAETTWFGQKAAGQWFIGAKIANVDASETGFSDAKNAGIILGYEFAKPIAYRGRASLEFDYTTSYDDGSIRDNSRFGGPGDWDADMWSLFFAYRTPGTVYFKGKLGVMQSDVNISVVGEPRVDRTDTSFSAGLGLGLLLGNNGNLELEYTDDSGDNDLGIFSLGGFVRF